MSNTIFTDGVTLTDDEWFNHVNDAVYEVLGDGTTPPSTAVAAMKNLFKKGADIASAATVNLAAATGNYIHVTGTTPITAFGTVNAGVPFMIVFDGELTLTHNATSLILPGGANITTATGDSLIAVSEGSGNWKVISYSKTSGAGLGSAISGASLVLLSSKTASASASLIFTSADFDWTLYNEYEFLFTQLIPVTNAVSLTAQISDDAGSSYKATNYISTIADINAVPAGPTATNSATTTAFNFSALTISNSSDYGMSGSLIINKPSSTIRKLIRWDLVFAGATSSLSGCFGIGQYSGTTTAWNGIRFLYSSGNIASGTITVYGKKIA